jgi:hypothetical protein
MHHEGVLLLRKSNRFLRVFIQQLSLTSQKRSLLLQIYAIRDE